MVKNAVDVIYGGLSYWLYGFAFSFGIAEGTNAFCGIGKAMETVSKLWFYYSNEIVKLEINKVKKRNFRIENLLLSCIVYCNICTLECGKTTFSLLCKKYSCPCFIHY